MAWVKDKPCAYPGCTALISGEDAKYCTTHDQQLNKSFEMYRDRALAQAYTTRRKKRTRHGKVQP